MSGAVRRALVAGALAAVIAVALVVPSGPAEAEPPPPEPPIVTTEDVRKAGEDATYGRITPEQYRAIVAQWIAQGKPTERTRRQTPLRDAPEGERQRQSATPRTFSVSAAASAAEGSSATLTVSLSEAAPSGGVSLRLTAGFGGSAMATSGDVGRIASPVSVQAGETSLEIRIPTAADDADEDDETFSVTVAAATEGWAPAGEGWDTAVVTIIDDDTAGVTISPTSLQLAEDGSGTYTVVLDSKPTHDVTVAAASSDSGAASVAPASHTFTPSNWSTARSFTVSGVADDDVVDERVAVSHRATSSDGQYGVVAVDSLSVSVTDDDSAPQQQQQQQQQAPAGDENEVWSATLTVHLSKWGRGCFNKGTDWEDGFCSSTAGLTDDDFTFGGATYSVEMLYFRVNSINLRLDAPITAALKTLTLQLGDKQFPLGDALIPSNARARANWSSADPGWADGDKVRVKLTRSATKTAALETTPRATPRSFSLSATASAAEGTDATLTISLSEPAPAGGLTFTVQEGYSSNVTATAADVGSVVSPVTVAEGQTTLEITIPTVDDDLVEGDETFFVVIAPTTTGWSKTWAGTDRDTATVTITDDDAPSAPITLADLLSATRAVNAGEISYAEFAEIVARWDCQRGFVQRCRYGLTSR